MLTIGPSQYDRLDSPCWWVVVNGTMVASLGRDDAGRWWAHLNLHYAGQDRWKPRSLASTFPTSSSTASTSNVYSAGPK